MGWMHIELHESCMRADMIFHLFTFANGTFQRTVQN